MINERYVRWIVVSCCCLLFTPCFSAAQSATLPSSQTEKESYSKGYQIGLSMKADNIEVNVDKLIQGLQHATENHAPLVSAVEMRRLTIARREPAGEQQMQRFQKRIVANASAAGKKAVMKLTITGQITKDNQNYIIRGKVPAELFTILNPIPSILDKLVDGGETVTIEAVSVMGDNVEVKKIDGTPYLEPK